MSAIKQKVFLLAAFAAVAAAVTLRPDVLSLGQTFGVLGATAVCLAPLILTLRGADGGFLPFMAGWGLFHAFFFGISLLLIDFGWRTGPPLYVYGVTDVVSVNGLSIFLFGSGVAVAIGGYFFGRRIFSGFPIARLPAAFSGEALNFVTWVLAIAFVATAVLPGHIGAASLAQLGDFLRFAVCGLLYYQWRGGRLSRLQAAAFLGVLGIDLWLRIEGRLFTPILQMALFLLVVHWRQSGRPPIRVLAAIAVLLFVAYDMRSYVMPRLASTLAQYGWRSETPPQTAPLQPLPQELDSLREKYESHGSFAVRRISYGLVFSRVVDVTPEKVSYWHGESYRNIFTNFVPRVLWPDKPREEIGGEFGRRYGFLDASDRRTSINLPWLIEAFVNFGPLGMMATVFGIGAFLGLLCHIFNHHRLSTPEAILGGALLFRLMFPESNFTVMTGNILSAAAAIYGAVFFGLWAFRMTRSRSSG